MFMLRPVAIVAALWLAGCASLPRERGYAETSALLIDRVGVAPDATRWSEAIAIELPHGPLTAEGAQHLAFVYNPRVRETYARIGLGRAELEDARRLSNPTFEFARARTDGDPHPRISRSLSLGFSDLLLLPARKRFAKSEIERVQSEVAAELLDLSVQVESAWYRAASAQQVADMRGLTARAAEASAALAQRFFDAGNIARLPLEQERAAATQARIEAVRAETEALKARGELATLTGLPLDAEWTLEPRLPAPPEAEFDAADLMPLALAQRLDLAAAKQAVAQREDMLGVSRRWRWVGDVEIGYEREHEGHDGVSRGPTLAVELPIFNQGQGSMERARSELIQARAELDALTLEVRNDATLAVQAVAVTRQIAERYRQVLVPAREAIVARTQEEVNYMLVGAFELILAKREEYDAYQEYLESVRDYWIARAELRRVVGGALPGDGDAVIPTLGVEAVMPSTSSAPVDHSQHGSDASQEASPHPGHGSGHEHEHSHENTENSAKDAAEHESIDPHAHHDHGDTP